MWLVQKIGLDAYESIDRVQWQEADVEQNKWIAPWRRTLDCGGS